MDKAVYQRMALLEKQHWWFRARGRILGEVLQTLSLSVPARLLEVGCGTGGNLDLLKGFGEVSALEPDVGARELCRQNHGINPDQGGLPDQLPYEQNSFDLVAALDVLEHVEDDRAALSAIKGLLKGEGYLLITVPAFPSLWSVHDESHHHYRRYRRQSLTQLLEESGFRIEYLSYYNCLLFPLVALIRCFKSLMPGGGQPDDSLPGPALNGFLEVVMASERGLLKRRKPLPFGVSLLALARPVAD